MISLFDIYKIDLTKSKLNEDVKKYQKWIKNNVPFKVDKKESFYYCNLMKNKFKELKLKNNNDKYWLETKNKTVINPIEDADI